MQDLTAAPMAEYDELVAAVTRRYGPCAQGVAYVLYEQLAFLRAHLAEYPDAVWTRARAWDVCRRIEELYYLDQTSAPQHPTTVVGTDPTVIEFDGSAFRRYGYDAVAPLVDRETIAVTGPRDEWQRHSMYLYVIDDRQQIRVWRRPFRHAELVHGIGRARIGDVPVAHPTIVADSLRACAAGEVMFIGAGRVAAVVANTRSGHFRPPPSCAPLVRRRFAEVFELDERDVDVIVVR